MNWQDKIDKAHKGQTGLFKDIENEKQKQIIKTRNTMKTIDEITGTTAAERKLLKEQRKNMRVQKHVKNCNNFFEAYGYKFESPKQKETALQMLADFEKWVKGSM